MKLSVAACYALAWRSFSKWWIPLCLISGGLTVFQFGPRILLHSDVKKLQATASTFMAAAMRNDVDDMPRISAEISAQAFLLAREFAKFTLYLLPLVALLTVILLMVANRAVGSRHGKGRSPGAVAYIALVHVVLVFVKLGAFLFLIVPGVYVYIKLLFVSLVMLEDNRGALAAVKASWRMTRGNFWRLFLLILMNTGLQVLATVTVVGLIPATGFANTARAAAFRMIREAMNGQDA